MKRAYKFRMNPTSEQRALFAQTFGCVRFIYNRMLADKIEQYEKDKTMLHNTPAQYKDEFPWLREVDSLALSNAQLHLQSAYSNFFRDPRVGFPKFKSKHRSSPSYTTNNQGGNIRIEDGKIKLPKVGWVKIKQHRALADGAVIKSCTISLLPSGKYSIAVSTERETTTPEKALDTSNSIGLDYSSPHFYVDSLGGFADIEDNHSKISLQKLPVR